MEADIKMHSERILRSLPRGKRANRNGFLIFGSSPRRAAGSFQKGLKEVLVKSLKTKALYLFLLTFFVTCLFIPRGAGAAEKLTIAAAADLSFAMKEIGLSFEKETGVKPVFSFGSTGMLTKQIEEGAPFDVFLAADMKHIDELKNGGYVIPESVIVYARGRIVLASNKSIGRVTLKDLLNPEMKQIKKIAIANPAHAPYGIAAMEALNKAGVWDKIKDKIVYGENIRQTLQYVQTGDAQAGIIALSIADVPEIVYTGIDSSLHNPITQAAAIVRTTKQEKAAKEFIGFIKGPVVRRILKKYGFIDNY